MEISFGGHKFIADCSGALYWPSRGTLIVADLHLEKASSFGMRGQFLPPYDSIAALEKLSVLCKQYQATRLITLGDNIHDRNGWARLPAIAQALLANIALDTQLLFLYGNHDKEARPPMGQAQSMLTEQGIHFSHEPEPAGLHEHLPAMAGHLHPCATISSPAGFLRTKCFVVTHDSLILPAFGIFTGGLDVLEAPFAPYATEDGDLYLCGAGAMHRLPLAAYIAHQQRNAG